MRQSQKKSVEHGGGDGAATILPHKALTSTIQSRAKINLVLSISPQVVDGKHLLTSIFTTVSLYDRISFAYDASSERKITVEVVSCTGANLPVLSIAPEQNIVYKAVETLEKTADRHLEGHLHIKIEKHIPHEAGLGGGSSNAAMTLLQLCNLWDLDPLGSSVLEAAQKLGADVSFFLYADCALMGGHGDKMLRKLPKPILTGTLVRPNTGVSTAAAYAAFDANPQPPLDSNELADLLVNSSKQHRVPSGNEIGKFIGNNLTAAATQINPEIKSIIDELESSQGVVKAILCGSGSTVFALCKDNQIAVNIAKSFEARGYWSKAVRTY